MKVDFVMECVKIGPFFIAHHASTGLFLTPPSHAGIWFLNYISERLEHNNDEFIIEYDNYLIGEIPILKELFDSETPFDVHEENAMVMAKSACKMVEMGQDPAYNVWLKSYVCRFNSKRYKRVDRYLDTNFPGRNGYTEPEYEEDF